MLFSWRWKRNESTGYKSLGTADDIESEQSPDIRSSNSTSSLSSPWIFNKRDQALDGPPPSPLLCTKGRVLIAANVLLFVTSLFILFIALPHRPSELNHALKQVSSYSPILDEIEIPLIDTQVQGDLFPSENPLLGRLEPGPAADELWQDFEIQRPFVLSREQVLALGKDPDKTVKYPDEDFGLGDDAYMGGMDAFHVLHCFNSIRKEAFRDYYFDGKTYHMEGYGPHMGRPQRQHTELWWLHLRHCTDIIVQFIMCRADATMTTMVWLETQERSWPDFSVNRRCVDFDALVRWRDEHALDIAKAGMVRRPADGRFQETKISEMYWRLMGNETMPGDNRHHPLWD